ncbi:CYTH domain-containing protein [Bacillus cytotoxicus]|uniref:Adenylate cyclase n=2 Tax=Bacillus cytotoxicus TaxID=580165 RepID=A0AAX2CDY1_9BACI|nr:MULTISPECIES: CYTH domain-containing protein [Bacillus cereus group]ABS21246.1 adenylate cyclase [Bacillus cytotoxicus NVH 391-98]AWC27893.1 CYTH domain-containing protein [Bacillus cytotoxicus]AWC31940.1 CYTH domain-containing protein [Bacillus cytotoxicus]AWC40726.1 CYTH domain-containing protein [Bacillus cytotoxicus]AWC43973.1 CYTH domain-containing protein [Bacillus cytotoxicus]
MTQEIEIEFKNMVTKEEFSVLCDAFSIQTFTKQVNHYFETPNFALKQAGSALRIRYKNGTYTLTLKQPAQTGLLETHQSLTQEEAKTMLETNHLIPGAVLKQLQALQIPVSSLTYMGSLTTERAETTFKGGILVFDHSFYYNHDDYELEYEVQDELTGKVDFLHLLNQYNIPVRHTKNKVQRFFLAKQSDAR